MANMLWFLLILAQLVLLTHSVPPFSFVPSRMFASYHRSMTPSTGFFSTTNHNEQYDIVFMDIHNNTAQHGLVLAGLDNMFGTACGFKVTIVSFSPSVYRLNLEILNTGTMMGMVSVFLVLIGTEANGIIQISPQLTHILTPVLVGTSTIGNPVNAGTPQTFTPSVLTTATLKYHFFLTSFNVQIGTSPAQQMVVAIVDLTAPASLPTVTYDFQTDATNTLKQVVYLILFFVDPPPMPANINFYYDVKRDYYFHKGAILAAAPNNSYVKGINRKCLYGQSSLSLQSSGFKYTFDPNRDLSIGYLQVFSSRTINFTVLCMVQDFNCSIFHPQCLICESHHYCTDCTDAYFVNTLYDCQLCSNVMPGCIKCQNTSLCQACNNPVYFTDPLGICLNCTQYLSHCTSCTDILACLVCNPGYGLDSTNIQCEICNLMMPQCQFCLNYTYCQQCFSGYFLSTPSTCTVCGTAIPNCLTCVNSSYCSSCTAEYFVSPDNSQCQCSAGFYPVTNYCAGYGCLSAQKFGTITYCLACDTSLHMQLINNECVCILGFRMQNKACLEICGDGRVIKTECDDGNLVGGDGCTSKCFIQDGYSCSLGDINNPSVCVFDGTVSLTLTSINKIPGSNQAQILMTLSTPVTSANIALYRMDFSSLFTITIGNAIPIQAAVSCDQNGILRILIDYNQDLQGEVANIALSFNPTVTSQPAIPMSFTMVGSNLPIVIAASSDLDPIISLVAFILGALFLVQLLTSLIFHKLIGLETMQISQIVFFVRFLLAQSSSMVIHHLNNLKYINIYNPFATYENIRSLDGKFVRMGISKTFIFNVFIHLFFIVIGWIVFLILRKKKVFIIKRQERGDRSPDDTQVLKKITLYYNKFESFIFIWSLYSLFLFAFSYLSASQSSEEIIYKLPESIQGVALIVMIYSAIYSFASVYENWRGGHKFNEQDGVKIRYISCFAAYQIILSSLMVGFQKVPFGIQIIAGIILVYTIFIISYKPYFLKPQNIMLIFNQIVVLLFVLFVALLSYIPLDSSIVGFITLGFEVLLGVVSAMGMIRLFIHYMQNAKAFKKAKELEQRAKNKKEKDDFHKEDMKKAKISNDLGQISISKRKQLEKEKEEEQLKRIKKRLKGQYHQQNEKNKQFIDPLK